MKKSFKILAIFLLISTLVTAQEEGVTLARQALKALTYYNMDPANNRAKLTEAKMIIDEAMQTREAKTDVAANIIRGDIYTFILQRDAESQMTNAGTLPDGYNNVLVAYEAYKTAFQKPEAKKYQTADALNGMAQIQPHLINMGINKLEKQDYEKAYQLLNTGLVSHELLKAAQQKSLLNNPVQYNDLVYFTAISAELSGRKQQALQLLEQLYKSGTDKPAVYSKLYKIKSETGNVTAANIILEEGRKKFPDDSGLLFDAINASLTAGNLQELPAKLKLAIAHEPANVGLYVTLGNVYDKLYQSSLNTNDKKQANLYFEEARNCYRQGLARDAKNADAAYSLGALYFNRAALLIQDINALPEDNSAEGIKKYNGIKNDIFDLFDQALPYLQKAESLAPNDLNTLVALTVIYERKEDKLMQEFTRRLKVVKSGGSNSASYFK